MTGIEGSIKVRGKRGVSALTFVFMALAMVFASIVPMGSTASAAPASWAAPRTVYFAETGHTLDRLFLDQWRNNGGQATYGLPITAEITQPNGHIIQYLQYARFEYWPEGDANGNTMVVSKIGQELRPTLMQRSVIGSTAAAQSSQPSKQDALIRAWLPVSADAANTNGNEYYVEATKHTIKNGFLNYWWNSGDVNFLGNPLTEEYILDGTTYQVFERGQLSWTAKDDVQLVPVGELLAKKYNLDTKAQPQGDVPTYSESLFIPPISVADGVTVPDANGDGWISYDELYAADINGDGVVTADEVAPVGPTYGNYVPNGGPLLVDVNLSTQYLILYQGNTVLLETYISSGRPGFDTPTGTFYVNTMLDSQTMEGVIGGEYYNVPDVPYVMYFTDVGHALHGTYWHNNFGTTMSHGCINMPMDAAAYLYSIAYIGMQVDIHY